MSIALWLNFFECFAILVADNCFQNQTQNCFSVSSFGLAISCIVHHGAFKVKVKVIFSFSLRGPFGEIFRWFLSKWYFES